MKEGYTAWNHFAVQFGATNKKCATSQHILSCIPQAGQSVTIEKAKTVSFEIVLVWLEAISLSSNMVSHIACCES
jgi:hypothetical protein